MGDSFNINYQGLNHLNRPFLIVPNPVDNQTYKVGKIFLKPLKAFEYGGIRMLGPQVKRVSNKDIDIKNLQFRDFFTLIEMDSEGVMLPSISKDDLEKRVSREILRDTLRLPIEIEEAYLIQNFIEVLENTTRTAFEFGKNDENLHSYTLDFITYSIMGLDVDLSIHARYFSLK